MCFVLPKLNRIVLNLRSVQRSQRLHITFYDVTLLLQSELMRTALEGLFNMAELPLDKSIDDRHDLPQVHALNILKCLYGDSGLHEALMQFIGKAVILVVEQFGSPAWSIRNAATRLFSMYYLI